MIYRNILCLALAFFFLPSEAHNRSESYSKFNFSSVGDLVEVQITGTIKQRIFNGLNPLNRFESYEELVTYLAASIDLGKSCKLIEPVGVNENNSLGVLKFFWSFECSQMPKGVSIALFQDFGVVHTHIARGYINEEPIPEFMFSSTEDTWMVGSSLDRSSNQSSYWGYLISGIQHILSGWDHLTFLLGMLLLFQGRFLIIAITGFTIGHSLTLGLGAMNVLRVHSEMIEILIGFSILLLAIENFFKHAFELNYFSRNLLISIIALAPLAIFGNIEPILIAGLALFSTTYLSLTNYYSSPWLPLLITIFFGLIHGLGFASSIAEVGLPQDRLWQIILSFNIGVEIGQLAVALFILGALTMVKGRFNDINSMKVHNIMGTIVFSMGTFWFISRAMGI